MSNVTKAYRRVQGGWHPGFPSMLCTWLAILAAGCTTMQPIDREAAATGIEPGQTVLVTTHDGRQLELVFDDWTSEALTGTDELGIAQKVENEDIARVEVERYSTARSVGLGVAVGAFLVGIAAAASDDGGLGY